MRWIAEKKLVDAEIGSPGVLGEHKESDEPRRRGAHTRCPQPPYACLPHSEKEGETEKHETDGRIRGHGDESRKDLHEDSNLEAPARQDEDDSRPGKKRQYKKSSGTTKWVVLGFAISFPAFIVGDQMIQRLHGGA